MNQASIPHMPLRLRQQTQQNWDIASKAVVRAIIVYAEAEAINHQSRILRNKARQLRERYRIPAPPVLQARHTPALLKKRRGFAAMSLEKRRAIAGKGGKSAHAQGRAHQFTSEEAQQAGRKGGTSLSQDRGHMAEIGRRGAVRRHHGGQEWDGKRENLEG